MNRVFKENPLNLLLPRDEKAMKRVAGSPLLSIVSAITWAILALVLSKLPEVFENFIDLDSVTANKALSYYLSIISYFFFYALMAIAALYFVNGVCRGVLALVRSDK